MKRFAFIPFVLVIAALAALQSDTSSGALPRATADREDDYSGLQMHAIYAVPSDGVDRGFDVTGDIENSTGVYQQWLAGQTGGRRLRFDSFQGSLDVTFHRLPRTDAQYAAAGLNIRDLLELDLRAAGLVTSRKVYAVYYDGTNSQACGGASWPPALMGTVAAFYLRAQVGTGAPCLSTGFAAPGGPPQYTEFAVLHEVLHPLGIVGTCAPHHTRAGHVSETPNDLMYAGDQPWTPSVLDIGRDDYFQAGRAGCPDLATVGFLMADAEFQLSVTKAGNGSGTVESAPWPVVDCGTRCAIPFPRGSVVQLRATATRGSFAGWRGACSGTADCIVTMDRAQNVMAEFRVSVPTCRVPRVVGRTLATARRLLQRAGCRVGRVRRVRSARPRGKVVRQAPRAGVRVRRGTKINLWVSRGRAK